MVLSSDSKEKTRELRPHGAGRVPEPEMPDRSVKHLSFLCASSNTRFQSSMRRALIEP